MTAEPLSGQYSDQVIDHFRNPRNAGEMDGADAEGFATNPVCGDSMRLFLRIERTEGTDGTEGGGASIAAASFLTSGCPASIATSSAATELMTGMRLEDAAALTREDFAAAVGGLPQPKLHCSVLAAAAVRNAIAAWRDGGGED